MFLDRDGVLNQAVVRAGRPFPPRSLEELVLIPRVAEACAALREAGVLLFCVTNQPDVARDAARRDDIAAARREMARVDREMLLMMLQLLRGRPFRHRRMPRQHVIQRTP